MSSEKSYRSTFSLTYSVGMSGLGDGKGGSNGPGSGGSTGSGNGGSYGPGTGGSRGPGTGGLVGPGNGGGSGGGSVGPGTGGLVGPGNGGTPGGEGGIIGIGFSRVVCRYKLFIPLLSTMFIRRVIDSFKNTHP